MPSVYCGAAMDLLLEEVCDTGDSFASIGTLALYECRSRGASCTIQTGHDPCWLPGPEDYPAQQATGGD